MPQRPSSPHQLVAASVFDCKADRLCSPSGSRESASETAESRESAQVPAPEESPFPALPGAHASLAEISCCPLPALHLKRECGRGEELENSLSQRLVLVAKCVDPRARSNLAASSASEKAESLSASAAAERRRAAAQEEGSEEQPEEQAREERGEERGEGEGGEEGGEGEGGEEGGEEGGKDGEEEKRERGETGEFQKVDLSKRGDKRGERQATEATRRDGGLAAKLLAVERQLTETRKRDISPVVCRRRRCGSVIGPPPEDSEKTPREAKKRRSSIPDAESLVRAASPTSTPRLEKQRMSREEKERERREQEERERERRRETEGEDSEDSSQDD
ncbi:hypothetical protein TGFOU_321550 [Toxoplasma gondii FOU]|uniref:Uncharacterized protein n=1 Tax=Toxoplasma gondii FOU TaxID=943167 RepID=A0A086JQP0_TOXGO|nr:hypothetical protein TGFOU_321550 [Toxoplasma gondii FOU]